MKGFWTKPGSVFKVSGIIASVGALMFIFQNCGQGLTSAISNADLSSTASQYQVKAVENRYEIQPKSADDLEKLRSVLAHENVSINGVTPEGSLIVYLDDSSKETIHQRVADLADVSAYTVAISRISQNIDAKDRKVMDLNYLEGLEKQTGITKSKISTGLPDSVSSIGFNRDLEVKDQNGKVGAVVDTDSLNPSLPALDLSLPSRIDNSLSKFFPPISDQSFNSCVGHSVGHYFFSYNTARIKNKSLRQPSSADLCNPLYLYFFANNGFDTGSVTHQVISTMLNHGCASMDAFPNSEDPFLAPSLQIQYNALMERKIGLAPNGFSMGPMDSVEKLNNIRTRLKNGDLVVFGTQVDTGFYSYMPGFWSNGVMVLKGSVNGGHALTAVGYDDHIKYKDFAGNEHTGALLFVNSWGTNWGASNSLALDANSNYVDNPNTPKGFAWIGYEDVLNSKYQFFYYVVDTTVAPTPTAVGLARVAPTEHVSVESTLNPGVDSRIIPSNLGWNSPSVTMKWALYNYAGYKTDFDIPIDLSSVVGKGEGTILGAKKLTLLSHSYFTASKTTWSDPNHVAFTFDTASKLSPSDIQLVHRDPASTPRTSVDQVVPVITSFTMPATSNSLTVTGVVFTATDNIGVVGYQINESETEASSVWLNAAPTTFTFSSSTTSAAQETRKAYARVKDAAGNISLIRSVSVVVGVPPPPVSTACTDARGLSKGQSLTCTCAAYDTANTNVSVWGTGAYTDDSKICAAAVHNGSLARGAAGSVTITKFDGCSYYEASLKNGVQSIVYQSWDGSYYFNGKGSATCSVLQPTLPQPLPSPSSPVTPSTPNTPSDTTAPTIEEFSAPVQSTSQTVSIVIRASDNVGVTGYYVNENPFTTPVWQSVQPTSYTFNGVTYGSRSFYLWVKDAAGNIAGPLSTTVLLVRP